MSDMEKQFKKALALFENDNYEEALPLFEDLAEDGDAASQYYCGRCFEEVDDDNLRDKDKAVQWYKKAADQGNTDAMVILSKHHLKGVYAEKSTDKALEFLRKAAQLGHSEAAMKLGEYYEKGENVTRDYKKAAEWYQKAVEHGNKWAFGFLQRLKDDGKI